MDTDMVNLQKTSWLLSPIFLIGFISQQVDVIITDFSKVFNTVDHYFLSNELESLEIGDPLFSWFKSYIFDRKQSIKVNGIVFNLTQVTSGVPQCGYLSPLFFQLIC